MKVGFVGLAGISVTRLDIMIKLGLTKKITMANSVLTVTFRKRFKSFLSAKVKEEVVV